MGRRRKARILALSILYQVELRPQDSVEDITYYMLLMEDYETSVVRFSQKLVDGVLNKLSDVDEIMGKFTDNWSVSRMATIDRNIIRISIFEMKYLKDIPKNVSINEAVEIAKTYSTEKSGEFVNGVLDRIGNFLLKGEKKSKRNKDNGKK